MLKFYLRLIVPTVLVSMVAAAGLAGTYAITKDRIAEQDRLAQEKALKAVLPKAAGFSAVTDKDVLASATKAGGETPVVGIFEAKGASDSIDGWGVIVTPRGYGGPMRIVVGVDRNGKVTGVNVVTQSETPGLGTKAVGTDAPAIAFRDKFTGVDSSAKAAKIDTITGATKSSRGVRKGVEAALRVFEEVLAKGGGSK